jgi:hypothetical protein
MRTEVRRGRKFVEYTDDSLPKGTFVQDISGADVSYQDEAGKWNPLDEGWETDGKDGFSFRASRMNHKVRFDSAGAWRWYPRRNVDTEYIVINRPDCWLTATNRWGNLLVNDISRGGKDITLTSLRNVTRVIHSRWNGIKTDWILENDKAPTHYRQKIDLIGITEKDGVLYGEDGTELARLTPTTATDANGKELPCEGKYTDGYLDFSVDTSGAAYPVTLDPDFAGATADGFVRGTNSNYSTARSTSYAYNSTNAVLFLGQFLSYQVYRNFLKFDTSSIPDNNTISQVNLKLVCTYDYSATDFDVQIVKQNWSSQDPLSDTNREAAYDNCLNGTADSSIWRNTSGISLNTQYASGNLDTSWVNKTGYTYYSLRSSRDYGNNTPTGDEYLQIASADNATSSYRPVLTVVHSSSVAYTLTCAAGSYALTGTSATFEVKRNYVLSCNAGSYALTGTATNFVLQRNFTLSLAGGSYSLTGTNANLVLQRNYTLACGAGNYTLTGSACAFTVLRNYTLACNSGSYAITGTPASFILQRNYTAQLNAGSYALTGTPVTFPITRFYALICEAGNYVLTGMDVAITSQYVMVLGSGSYSLTGTDAVITRGYTLTTIAGNYALTGINANLTRGYTSSLNSGSYAVTGTNALFEVRRNYVLPLDSGSYVLTGTSASFSEGGEIVCEAGSYALTGTPVTFSITRAYALTCNSGSYILTGSNVNFSIGLSYALTCNAGTYALTGTPVILTIQHNYALALNSGPYILTGTDAAFVLQRNYLLSLAAGNYALTGTPAAITSARALALGTGNYALTGTNAGMFKGLVLPCNAGSYALTGSDITVNAAYIFALNVGSYVLVGTPCGLFILTQTPACRTYTIPHEDRTLEVKCH